MNTMTNFRITSLALVVLAASSTAFTAQAQLKTPAQSAPTRTLPAAPASAAAPAAQAAPAVKPAEGARPLDEIAAVVNDDVITEFELQQQTHIAALNLRRQNIKLPPMDVLRRQVLDQLIMDKAVEQHAREVGIRVDDAMVSAAIEQIAANNKVTVAQMQSDLAKDGVPFAAFREQIRREIVAQRLREREVDSQIHIPESEIDSYLASQGKGAAATEYHISHILIPTDAGTDVAKAKALAEDILKRAKSGEDFSSLAVSYSKAGDSMNGGELGWRTSQNMPTALWNAIQEHHQNGSVELSQDSSGFHIVKVTGVRNGIDNPANGGLIHMTRARHILMQVSQLTPEAGVVSRLKDIRNKILAGKEDFQTMARLHSVDPSSTRGGELGWLQPGDTVPEFESAMDKLKPGEVSEPIKSRFGYHLIQVEERKDAKADPRRVRLAALQALREKKLAEAVTNWQRELRDKAYVEIRQVGN